MIKVKVEIYFTDRAICVPELETGKECGAVVEFRGIVRGFENGEAIPGLVYEAHESMAKKQLQKMIAEIQREFPCERLVFMHRLGTVKVGETSLYVRVDSKHRAQAFGFCEKLIDRMKEDVPIWKQVV